MCKLVRRKRWHVTVGSVVLALAVGISAQWSRMRGLASTRDESIVRAPWVGQPDHAGADALYADFMERLHNGQSTTQEQDLFFTNAFGLKLATRKLWALDRRIAATIDLSRRIDFREYGYTALVTITLLVEGERVSSRFCMPWSSPQLSFTALEDTGMLDRESMAAAESLIAECVICVHRTRDVPADVCSQAKENSDWGHPNTVWRQVRMLEAPITVLPTLPPDYPKAIAYPETKSRVEQAFQVERILLTASTVNIEYRYGLNVPIAGRVEVLCPDGSELLPPSKFTRTGAVGTRQKDYNVHVPAEILTAVSRGQFGSLRLAIKPSLEMALAQPDFECFYGLPIEREVPVVLAAEDGTGKVP